MTRFTGEGYWAAQCDGAVQTLRTQIQHGLLTDRGLDVALRSVNKWQELPYLNADTVAEMEWLREQIPAEQAMRQLDRRLTS